MNIEPTNAELIAAASGLILAMRRMIEATNRSDQEDVSSTFDTMHEFLAISGGSLMIIWDSATR
ncbi:hypothetical protein KUV73_19615 [Mameliella alba]|nr:hypothetical protein [Mameliella alba]MBY6171364.1 hypothetical protein [Mameliella alba]MBY6176588.1 hypothetical protein [Mameliella alba]